MSRSCSPPRSDSFRSAGRKKMSEGGQKLIIIGAVGQCQVSGKRNRTVSIRSLRSSWSTKEKRIYNLLWVSSPCTIILIHLCTAVLSQVVHIYKLDKNKKPSDISYRQLGGAREMTGVWDIIDRSILNPRLAVQRNWIKQNCAKLVDNGPSTRRTLVQEFLPVWSQEGINQLSQKLCFPSFSRFYSLLTL